MEKRFKGKALYQPSGKAAEYSPWAVNFYTGCSNDCTYCYCKRGVMSHVWDNKPQIKKCFRNTEHAIRMFSHELAQNIDKVKESGILFSFTTDPMLPETKQLTLLCTELALDMDVPVKILTKSVDWFYEADFRSYLDKPSILQLKKNKVAFGFTLTGFDEEEPFASSNHDRIEVMRNLYELGFKTFASIEPVLTPAMSWNMIQATKGFCNLFKVGLISGKKINYDNIYIDRFFVNLTVLSTRGIKIYLKDSFLKWMKLDRNNLPGDFVNSDYNIFKEK